MNISPVKRQLDILLICIAVAIGLLVAVVVAHPSHSDTAIGDATWDDCFGGVLPDQTEVPEPVPMS